MKTENNTNWKNAKIVFPPLDKPVLGYYEIEVKDKKKVPTGDVYRYYIICSVSCITERSSGTSVEWEDVDLKPVFPEYWDYLPDPPIKQIKNLKTPSPVL
jgi:hypothetical protein